LIYYTKSFEAFGQPKNDASLPYEKSRSKINEEKQYKKE